MPDPGAIDAVVRSRSVWSVLALSCLIDLLELAHCRQSIGPNEQMAPLFDHASAPHVRWAA